MQNLLDCRVRSPVSSHPLCHRHHLLLSQLFCPATNHLSHQAVNRCAILPHSLVRNRRVHHQEFPATSQVLVLPVNRPDIHRISLVQYRRLYQHSNQRTLRLVNQAVYHRFSLLLYPQVSHTASHLASHRIHLHHILQVLLAFIRVACHLVVHQVSLQDSPVYYHLLSLQANQQDHRLLSLLLYPLVSHLVNPAVTRRQHQALFQHQILLLSPAQNLQVAQLLFPVLCHQCNHQHIHPCNRQCLPLSSPTEAPLHSLLLFHRCLLCSKVSHVRLDLVNFLRLTLPLLCQQLCRQRCPLSKLLLLLALKRTLQ